MEGLIPYVYRAIMEYKYKHAGSRKQSLLGSLLNDSPSTSYIRLPGDSGRFQSASDYQFFRSDYGFSSSPPPSSATPSPISQRRVSSSGIHSPIRRRFSA